jgi:NAD-dependent deacetylase
MLIIGTSALVYPAAELPIIARRNDTYLVEINPEETPISGMCQEVIREKAAEGVRAWWRKNLAQAQSS